MLFKQLIDEFLDKWDKDTSKAYRKKIYSFYQYLVEMKNATDSNYKSILKGLEIEDVAESIIFYVKRNQVKYRASADLYISTVKSFYAYISAKQIKERHLFRPNMAVPIYILIIKRMHQT